MDVLLQRRIYFTKHELAHLAADVLLLFASVWGCLLISGESLKTSKSTGWRILRYKSHLLGIRFRSEHPLATSLTCQRCGKPADTYRSPQM